MNAVHDYLRQDNLLQSVESVAKYGLNNAVSWRNFRGSSIMGPFRRKYRKNAWIIKGQKSYGRDY